MDWQYVSQAGLAGLIVLGFFASVYGDFQPRTARPPLGFGGFIGTCISVGLMASLAYGAGAFSLLGK